MGWFPVFADLIDGEEFKSLTPTEKLYFLHLISRFNKDGEFFQADDEIAATLATDVKTIRRGRPKLEKMGLIQVIPGRLTERKRCIATQYLKVRYARIKPEEDRHFAKIQRHTFEVMLNHLRKTLFQPGDVIVYVCLYYFYHRNRGKREDHQFYIKKEKLQSLTGLQDASTRVSRIYEAFTFSSGCHLFEYQDKHQRFIIKNWEICGEPEKNENNRRIAESFRQKIKDTVARKKQERRLKAIDSIKAQQKTMKSPKNKRYPSPLSVFIELYMKRYGRMPSSRGDKKFGELEQTFGRGVICRAVNWYFTADAVPNGSGAKTRTLCNFVCHIDEILKLSAESAFV